jgi:branched-chain amino acid transport system permease protein
VNYLLHLVIYFEIYAIVALSLNLMVGYCGLLTLAHAAYFAIGGYSYALLASRMGFVASLGSATVITALLSLAVSLPAMRFKGDFFILATLAVQTFVHATLYNWVTPGEPVGSWKNLTNGPFGIAGIPKPSILSLTFNDRLRQVELFTVLTILVAFVVWRLLSSPWARLLLAMRDDELATRGLGKNVQMLKVGAIALSSSIAAVAGASYAGYVGYLDPSAASLDESILMLCMVLVGGAGNFRGPVTGAAVLVGLPEVLRFLQLPDTLAVNLRLMIYGAALVLLMRLRPQGLCGVYRIT